MLWRTGMKKDFLCVLSLLVVLSACNDNTLSLNLDDVSSCSAVNLSSSSRLLNRNSSSSWTTVGNSEDPGFACSESTKKIGLFIDSRDGHVYRTVTIGNQVWMAENLVYKNYNHEDPYAYSWIEAIDSVATGCHSDELFVYDGVYFENCPIARPAQGLCPDGWHLPTADDLQALVDFAGGPKYAGKYLKSTMGWEGVGNGVDCFGFDLMPSTKDGFVEILSSDVRYYGDVITLVMSKYNAHAEFSTSMKEYGFGNVVRCIQGEGKKGLDLQIHRAENTYTGPFDSLIDARDGHVYKTVDIGGWVWMAENLAYGSKETYTYEEMIDAPVTGCYLDSLIWGDDYGMWNSCSAELPIQGICPDGWHVPSSYEWNVLSAFVNGLDNADDFAKGAFTGQMLKSTSGWPSGKNGLDAYGFGAKPANGEDEVRFWSSTDSPTKWDWFGNIYMVIGADSAGLEVYEINRYNNSGYPVRCLKDGENQQPSPYMYSSVGCDKPSPYSGEYGLVTDERDGNVYRTVNIDGTVWFVDNLKYDVPGGLTFCNCGDTTSCDAWGRLYPWTEAKVACPAGWRLPILEEAQHLVAFTRQTHYDLGGCNHDGDLLRATEGWKYEQGNNMLGFGAVPAGLKYFEMDEISTVTEEYCNKWPWEVNGGGGRASFWLYSDTLKRRPDALFLDESSKPIDLSSASDVKTAYSIRCVKE